VNEQGLALRVAPVAAVGKGKESGLSVGEFERRLERKVVLSCLAVESRCFKGRRDRAERGEVEE
jgi:protein farnesyltransferase/geranylgeranyltransferase type-1 subunit alpha